MAANIRTINEFPPKFAHHVTFYTATKELRRRGDRPRSRLPPSFLPPKKVASSPRVQARPYFISANHLTLSIVFFFFFFFEPFYLVHILPAGFAHKNVYSDLVRDSENL